MPNTIGAARVPDAFSGGRSVTMVQTLSDLPEPNVPRLNRAETAHSTVATLDHSSVPGPTQLESHPMQR